MDTNKVVLGLSGGTDSAAAAILLKEKGMDVTALYFDVTKEGDADARTRAEELAKDLSIPFLYRNVWDKFEKIIIEPFCYAYENGCTPMPCMVCNPYIKWQVLKETADELGAYWLATGHYANLAEEEGVFYVKKAANLQKDQSYMLARLGQSILSRAIFPLGEYASKDDVKELVRAYGLSLPASLKESQDICFISGNYKDFLVGRGFTPVPGNFVDEAGSVIGTHNGYTSFTIGQGKGLGMGFNKKMYVKEIRPETAEVVLSENEALYTYTVAISVCSFAKYGECSRVPEEYQEKEFQVKIRYAAKPGIAVLRPKEEQGIADLIFHEAQRAPAFGQYAVLYAEDKVIGCGIIS